MIGTVEHFSSSLLSWSAADRLQPAIHRWVRPWAREMMFSFSGSPVVENPGMTQTLVWRSWFAAAASSRHISVIAYVCGTPSRRVKNKPPCAARPRAVHRR
jgi:hypothetical protein